MASIEEANKFTYVNTPAPKYRSTWNRSLNHTLTLKEGDIVPIYHTMVPAGSTIQLGLAYVIRMLTPVSPVMSNAYIDFYAFSQPCRSLCAKYHLTNINGEYDGDFETLFGENKTGYWAEEETTYLNKYGLPLCNNDATGTYLWRVNPQSVCDYMGVPIGKAYNGISTDDTNEITGISTSRLSELNDNLVVNGLPYALMEEVYNYWFRDENLIAPTDEEQLGIVCDVDKNGKWAAYYLNHKYGCTDGDHLYSNTNKDWTGETLKYPFKAAKLHDMFTESLPQPYKGDTIEIGLAGLAPVDINASGNITAYTNLETPLSNVQLVNDNTIRRELEISGKNSAGVETTTTLNTYGIATVDGTGTADLSEATAITIADLRTAFALQHLEEVFAMGGTRYDEVLQSLYGTAPSKAELQRPEYLGGSRVPINISQVVSTAQTNNGDLGELGAFSHTGGMDGTLISKSFTEWTEIIVVAVIRTDNAYFQGIDRLDQTFELADFYIPQLEGVGEQEVRLSEIYAYKGGNLNNIFGYIPRYNQFRYESGNKLSGYINPMSGDQTLKSYTFAIPFDEAPTLNEAFITEPYQKVANVLYDQTTASQFLMDTHIDITETAPIKLFSLPGLTRM